MKNYFAPEPKQLSNYLARREWNKQITLPPELEAIKQSLINQPRKDKQ